MLRETQHYQFANGLTSDDTLDVDARSLAPIRYTSVSSSASFDVRIVGTHIDGWRSDSAQIHRPVHEIAAQPFLVSIMTEGFAEAMPFETGRTMRIPTANPPSPTVRELSLTISGSQQVRTAGGLIDCFVVTGPARTTSWVEKGSGHLVRMRWTLPNGAVVTKLPSRDVRFLVD